MPPLNTMNTRNPSGYCKTLLQRSGASVPCCANLVPIMTAFTTSTAPMKTTLCRSGLATLLLVCLLTLLLAGGCATPPESKDEGSLHAQKLNKLKTSTDAKPNLPQSLTAAPAELEHYSYPQNLAGMTFSGEISSAHARTFRYQHPDNQESLYIILSALPAGWQEMDQNRSVASFYSEIRQRRVQRALSNPANALSILNETLVDLEGSPTAQVQMRWIEPGKPVQNQALLITRDANVFIRINNASYQQNTRWLLQQTKRALAEFRAAQSAPEAHKSGAPAP